MTLKWDDVKEGQALPELRKAPGVTQLVKYAAGSGDFNPLHHDYAFPQAKQLGCLAAGHFPLTIEFEHDKLARSLFHRTTQLFKQIDQVLIEFDVDSSHGWLEPILRFPAAGKNRRIPRAQ